MFLWLDDVRPAPVGWTCARNVDHAVTCMMSGEVEAASLDHDLGDQFPFGGDGTKFTDWMAEHDCWPYLGIRVHSSNPVGSSAMLATIDRYGPYTRAYGRTRGSEEPFASIRFP